MPRTLEMTASQEDYLEAIYCVVQEAQVARVKEIASRLGVHASSVTGALRHLAEKGLVHYDPYQVVTLTPAGDKVARGLVRRHAVLREFLEKVLALNPEVADRNACQIEHAIEPEVLERLVRFIEFLKSSPDGCDDLIAKFAEECSSSSKGERRKKAKGA